jgi:outer membrane protein assembly factor BamB
MTLSSPVVVDDTLLQGDGAGVIRAWSLNDTKPDEIWRTKLSGNIESTMAVWRGSIYVGARGGYFYKISTTN